MTDHWCKYCNGVNTHNCQFNPNLPRTKIYMKNAVAVSNDEVLLRQALEALEIFTHGLIQMREHAEAYGEAWARAYVKEYRDLLPGAAEEQFRSLNTMQHRLADVADGLVKAYDTIDILRKRLGV